MVEQKFWQEEEKELGEKFFWQNFISTEGWTCKKYRNKAGMRKVYNTVLLRNDGGLLSGPQRNPLASLVHFLTHALKCVHVELISEKCK